MNFDQLKAGDTVYYGFLGENDGFVRHAKISNIRDCGYLQFRDNNGGEFIVLLMKGKLLKQIVIIVILFQLMNNKP